MSDTMREIVSALVAKNPEEEEEERVLISIDIEDDKLFLLHFIIGTYFGPDLKQNHHHKQSSAFQIQAASAANLTSDYLNASLLKRAEVERVYRYILNNADQQSLIVKPKTLRRYFNGKRSDSDEGFPLFTDLYPSNLHPETRVQNKYKFITSIVFINDPDTSCMRRDCIDRFKRLTRLESFTLLRFNIDVGGECSHIVVAASEVEDESMKDDIICLEAPPVFDHVSETIAGPVVGLMEIGECDDAYLFRVSLPGVKRDERDFSCEVEDNGNVLVRGVTTTGEKQVHRYSQVFEMQTQNLCPSGNFSVSFCLPGPVHPQEFSGSFGTDGILEGIVMKNLHKQIV